MDSMRAGHPPTPRASARAVRLGFAILVAAMVSAALAPVTSHAALGCDHVAAPGGSDKAAGTEGAPWATFKHLAEATQPGETGCLRGGTYDEDVKVKSAGSPGARITIQSYPGEWARLLGRLQVDDAAAWVTFRYLTLDGSGAPQDGGGPELLPSPTVHGDDIAFIADEVTNRHTAICYAVGNESYGIAYRLEVRQNRIHDCGRLPPTNHEHGIYLHSPGGAQVTDNWIHDNADTGLNLYPDADGHYFARNVLYANGDNLSFAGHGSNGGCTSSDNNLVERNVMSHPRVRSNITSWTPCGHEGTGNLLRENCIWPATFEGHGFTLLNNLYVQPAYVNEAAKDFRIVQGTPCAPLLDNPDVPGTEALPVPGMWGTGIGAGSFTTPANAKGKGRRAREIILRARRRVVRLGGRLVLIGRVREGVAVPDSARALIEVRGAKRWLSVRGARIGANRRFRVSLRLKQRGRPHARLLLGGARLSPSLRKLRLRARVPDVGRSAIVRVRVRH